MQLGSMTMPADCPGDVPFCSSIRPRTKSACSYEDRAEPKTVSRRLLGNAGDGHESDNQARLRVAALIYLIVNAVVFGVGLISVLMTPTLAQHAFFWIPAIIVISFALSAPVAWFIAPSMMMRFIKAR